MNEPFWRNHRVLRKYILAAVCLIAVGGIAVARASVHLEGDKYHDLLSKYEHAPGQAVVKVRNNKGRNFLHAMEKGMVDSLSAFETNANFYSVKLHSEQDLPEFLAQANKNPDIAYAEPNYIMHIDSVGDPQEVIPNDDKFAQLWGLKNAGQADSQGRAGLAGADIGAAKAWGLFTGSASVVVAVIDTGVDYNHQELAANIYHNPGESGDGRENNRIDDDGNGFVDDYVGWNFAGVSNNNPMDDHYHGTHVSGTIAAAGNNGMGVTGVSWNAQILPVKFLSASGSGTLENAVKAVQYATLMKVNIMSNSWSGGPFTQSLYDAIVDAKNQGILFVAAAGNDASNMDNFPNYPAGYQVDNVIAVAATNNRDQLANFSAYGRRLVHIAAPGVNILSLAPNNQYSVLSGTSMATPHVSGAAALVWGYKPDLNYAGVKERLLKSRDPKANLAQKVNTGGRLNVYNALTEIYPPGGGPADSDWIDGDPISVVESVHPYMDNFTRSWVIQGPPNAKYMRLHFSRFETEASNDFVRISGKDRVEVDKLSGRLDANSMYSWHVAGNEVHIQFTSDESNQDWGFAIDKFQYVPQ